MHRVQRILLLIFAVAGFAHTDCRHTKKSRNIKLDICNECKELLNEMIDPAFVDLKRFSECVEKNHNSSAILKNVDLNVKVTEAEMLAELPVFISQLNLMRQAWEVHNLPMCSHNLDKHLRRILCLVRGSSKRKQKCVSKQRTKRPKAGRGQAIDYTGNYIRKVYSTLHGFVNSM